MVIRRKKSWGIKKNTLRKLRRRRRISKVTVKENPAL
jgi:hypothetical protein